MEQLLEEFVNPTGPTAGKAHMISVTTASVHIDLTGASYTVLLADINGGRLMSLIAEGDIFYRWSTATSGETVDETMAASGITPANQCGMVFAGERLPERPVVSGSEIKGIVVKAPVACRLRIVASSRNPADYMKGS